MARRPISSYISEHNRVHTCIHNPGLFLPNHLEIEGLRVPQMVSGIVKVETLLYSVLVKPNCLDCSRYEEFVKMSEAHAEDLSGMVRLMIGFFVSQLFRRWWWQFQVCRETRCH